MILDSQTQFSDAQAITATAASTNLYDTGSSADSGPGGHQRIFAIVDEAFNTLTSLAISLETDDNSSFSSPATLWSKTFLLAALTLNAKLDLPGISSTAERYYRLKYTVAGSNPTLGKITSGVVLDDQKNTPTPDGIP
jgi:hypothetical protein